MASPWEPDQPGPSGGMDSSGRVHRLPELQCSHLTPRPPVHVKDTQSALRRRVTRRGPSVGHLRAREQMYFPGWHTRSPSPRHSGQRQKPSRKPLPVHLPPLSATTQLSQNVDPSPGLPAPPFPMKAGELLDAPDDIRFYEYGKGDFTMISRQGVLSVRDDECDFVTVQRWQEEDSHLRRMSRIPFFALFKKWKPFRVWRTKVRAKKMHLAKESLRNHSFIASQSLSPALVDIRKMCCQISATGLCHVGQKHTYALQDFKDTQFKQLQERLKDLEKFEGLVKEVTVCACRNYLMEPQSKCNNPSDQNDKKLIVQIHRKFLSGRLVWWVIEANVIGY